jgi:hypothetical protein
LKVLSHSSESKKTGKIRMFGRTGTLSGTSLERAFLRREQQETLGMNHRENPAKGKEDVTSTALRKEVMAVQLQDILNERSNVAYTLDTRQRPLSKQLYDQPYLGKQRPLLGNCCNSYACKNTQRCFMCGPCTEVINGSIVA